MTGRVEEGAEVRLKSMCDERKEARGWRDKDICSETGKTVHKILYMNQCCGMPQNSTTQHGWSDDHELKLILVHRYTIKLL